MSNVWESALHGAEQGFDDLTELAAGAYTAPTPGASSPPRYTAPATWYPPSRELDGDGTFYTVHTNALHTVADTIRSQLPGLDKAISELRSFSYGSAVTNAMPGWVTGTDFGSQMQQAATGFVTAAGQVADIHFDAVQRLSDTASAYAAAEDANYRQVMAIEAAGDAVASLQPVGGVSNPRSQPAPVVRHDISIKPNGYLAPTDAAAMSLPDIMACLHGIRPDAYGAFGGHLRELADALSQVARQIVDGVAELARNWEGSSAATAFQAFQILHGQTATLAAQAAQAGNVMNWLGNDVLSQFQKLPFPRILSHADGLMVAAGTGDIFASAGQARATEAARQYLTALNCYLNEAYNAIPDTIASEENPM